MFFKQFIKLTSFSSQSNKISWRRFFCLFHFNNTITPLSIGCTILVILGGKNFTMIPLCCNDVVAGCDGMLSTNKRASSKRPLFLTVMGSIEENRYRYGIDTLTKVSKVSILVSILRYPFKNPHHELHIHKLVTYFDFRTSNFLGFFDICPFLPR